MCLLQIIASATFLGTPRACSLLVRSLLPASLSPDHSHSYTFVHMDMSWPCKQFCVLCSLLTCIFVPPLASSKSHSDCYTFFQVADRGSYFPLCALVHSPKKSFVNTHSPDHSDSYTFGHCGMSANVRDIRSAPQIIAIPSTSRTLLLRRVVDSSSRCVMRD